MTDGSDRSIFDNAVLDEYQLPIDAWADQAVDWIANNLGWLLAAVEWPFSFLVEDVVNDFLIQVSWVWIVGSMALTGLLLRGVRVAGVVAAALVVCGLLGSGFWIQTTRSIGLVLVAFSFCVLIGIPLGVAAARVDRLWRVVRPILDAMQVVHPFVYLVPFVFFWGIGPAPATMVTTVFALPPLVRLTHLGIRQVPEQLVEASRSFGASERQVLFDLQLPLARPAIAVGVNQTLLLSVYMLAIAAIMGAGGLGRVMFQALTGQDIALAVSAGLAYFLVAVVLDRLSQPDEGDASGLLRRIGRASKYRTEPQVLLDDRAAGAITDHLEAGRGRPLGTGELLAMSVTAVGAAVATASVFLDWANDGGYMSSFARQRDERDLVGQSFNGLSASGGSWFGFFTLALGLFAIVSLAMTVRRPGSGARWMSPDGITIAAVGLAVMNLAHLLANQSDLAAASRGIGVHTAVAGSVTAAAGAILWSRMAPQTPLRPLGTKLRLAPLAGACLAVLILLGAGFAGWSFDNRTDIVISTELEAEIDRLAQAGRDDPDIATVNAAEITAIVARATSSEAIVIDGVSGDGSRLGLWSLLAGVAAAVAAVPASGLSRRDEHHQWVWGSVTAALGAGIILIGVAWIATVARVADPGFVSGVGAFLAVVAGLLIVATARSVIIDFRRQQVYDDVSSTRRHGSPPDLHQPRASVRVELI